MNNKKTEEGQIVPKMFLFDDEIKLAILNS